MFSLLMNWMKANHILPKISDTERQALEAGSVWIDGGLFAGNPDFKHILSEPYSRLSSEEQAFIDGPCEQLLKMFDHYEVATTRRIPPAVLEFIKKEGFMSFLIPKQYGGKEFSILAISTIMAKLNPASTTIGTYVVIPNSLGAAELIKHYGTDEQKNHYLPRLARGEFVPCFGLTEPTAGSDAASIKAEGEVFRDTDGTLKIKMNFRKRYITLAPVANLATIACKLDDPQNLLGKGTDVGITCVLIEKGTPGFTNGDHHQPIGDPFDNGPLYGKDVIVPVANIIGGGAKAGQGWRMLMEQLAGGRMVSLPAGAIGGAKTVAAATGAYSMVRQQFGISVGRMEGVEEKVGKIAGLTYMLEGARVFGCSAVDNGQQPPVVSAVMKAYSTEISREIVKEGMDVMAGAAVMQGPNNILGRGYQSAPVGVTVEGANILTRTLMIFGQGATRCHPYALNVVNGVEKNDVALFRKNLLGWMLHFVLGYFRTVVRSLTRGLTVSVPDVHADTRTYYRRLGWAAARYGFLTDMAMFAIGGKLKMRGKLTGRYADALAWQLLGIGALRRFEAEGRRPEDLALVHYALNYALAEIQQAFVGIYANFDGVIGSVMRFFATPFLRINPIGAMPTDAMSAAAARTIQSHNAQFKRLAENVYLPAEGTPGMGRLLRAFRLVTEAEPILAKIHTAQKDKRLPRGPAEELAAEAAYKGVITREEANQVAAALTARLDAIEVDVFTPEQYYQESKGDEGIYFGAPEPQKIAA
ncbi:MAG: acyl-CoA dehydrogenase [Stagnimonas sp.]|nr:acyl-CoA dehydrogenase [Stagnimonas sp.]